MKKQAFFCFLFLWGLSLCSASTLDYFVVHAWNPGSDNPYTFTNCSTAWVSNMTGTIGEKGNNNTRLAFADVIYVLNTGDEDIIRCLGEYFNASEENNIPFLLHLDTEYFWSRSPELWNWFNSSRPGYNASNRENVEWASWDVPMTKGFLNWGSALELAPRPCYDSTSFRSILERRLILVAEELKAWKDDLDREGKSYLFVGVDIGWETGIDSYEGVSWVPESYRNHTGYCSLTYRGFSSANPPSDREYELQRAVNDFNSFRAKVFFDEGISKEDIYTHTWAIEDLNPAWVQHHHGPMWTGITNYSTLGLSVSPGNYNLTALTATVNSVDSWAISETPATNFSFFSTVSGYGDCKYAVMYVWGQIKRDYPSVINNIKSFLPDTSCNSDGTDSSDKCNVSCGASSWCAGLSKYSLLSYCNKGGLSGVHDRCSSTCQTEDRSDNVCRKVGVSDCAGENACDMVPAGNCSATSLKKCDSSCMEVSSCGDGSCNCGENMTNCLGDCPNTKPKGYLDYVGCDYFLGWSCDNDYNSTPLSIHFYKEGNVLVGYTTANITREAAVGSQCGGNISHGFQYTTPSNLKDGVNHSIYAYGINMPVGSNALLTTSPKQLVCTTTTTSTTTTTQGGGATTTSTSTTSTIQPCQIVGDTPTCGVVTLQEVINAINNWTAGSMSLSDVVNLISYWMSS